MSDQERAKKIAAAKKKLKAYQSHDKQNNTNDEASESAGQSSTKPQLENYFSGNNDEITTFQFDEKNVVPAATLENSGQQNNVAADKIFDEVAMQQDINIPAPTQQQQEELLPNIMNNNDETITTITVANNSNDKLDTMKLLIAEKCNLNSELANAQTALKEKHFEMEEMNTRFLSAKKRVDDLEQSLFEEQIRSQEYHKMILNLKKENEEKTALEEHIQELNKELANEKKKTHQLNRTILEKNNELELNSIRINQISDESTITIDNRIETLTQTKFMYEQQIMDLQTMVLQLKSEKDQANQQYQNYVQHLTKDMNSLTEKNSSLNEELMKLADRENHFIDHIGSLERQIQNNISKNQIIKENQEANAAGAREVEELMDKLNESMRQIDRSKTEYERKLNQQKQDLITTHQNLQDKTSHIIELQERLDQILSDRPDDERLLAAIEHDKVAASRAMIQNAELREQMDEIQIRLIELTNDKMDLTTDLHSEKHANREMRMNYEDYKNKIITLNDKLYFKDEEMIRLTHEVHTLVEKIEELEKQLGEEKELRQKHENAVIEEKQQHSEETTNDETINDKIGDDEMVLMKNNEHSKNSNDEIQNKPIATNEAMQRLEERFTNLMSEVADLTDEKQRLEHLVLQLQSETETIGEYVALYQTQRRNLKQKEFEKDAQLHRLSAEREELRENINRLSILVSRLDINVAATPNVDDTNTNRSVDNNDDVSEASKQNGDATTATIKINPETEQIVAEINTIITEIKNNDITSTDPIVDHCACCSGKFETI